MNLTGYNLSRKWFDFCFENPEKIAPIHSALYLFAMEHCNRLGWKQKFNLPTEMAKEAIGVKSWHTYIKAFNDLVDWGFFILIERSKNQYSSNIISLSNFDEALDEALDEAITKHESKHEQTLLQSNDSIYKLITDNLKQITDKYAEFEKCVLNLSKPKKPKEIIIPSFDEFKIYALENKKDVNIESLNLKYKAWVENGWSTGNDRKIKNWKSTLLNTLPFIESKQQNNTQPTTCKKPIEQTEYR